MLPGHPHALLRGGGSRVVALLLAQENPLELDHTRVGEHQRGVAVQDEGRRSHAPMAPLGEVRQELLSNLRTSHDGGGYRIGTAECTPAERALPADNPLRIDLF